MKILVPHADKEAKQEQAFAAWLTRESSKVLYGVFFIVQHQYS